MYAVVSYQSSGIKAEAGSRTSNSHGSSEMAPRSHTSALQTSAYVSIRQHTSAYVSMRIHLRQDIADEEAADCLRLLGAAREYERLPRERQRRLYMCVPTVTICTSVPVSKCYLYFCTSQRRLYMCVTSVTICASVPVKQVD